jgi:hypothetical protein
VHLDRRFLKILGAAVVVAALIVVIVLSRQKSDSKNSSNASGSSSTSTTTTNRSAGTTTTTGAGPTTTEYPLDKPYTTPNMPLTVQVSNTDGLSNGATVSIHVSPDSGSQMFGVDARLCAGNVAIVNDGMFLPTVGGNCIVDPFTADSDSKVSIAATPPYQGTDLTFRVGTGTTTYRTQTGASSSVTCDAAHPCQIALKMQYPNGFGFQGIPVTFR